MDKAKKLIMDELKNTHQDVFEDVKVNLEYLTLYSDIAKTKAIMDKKLPVREEFYALLKESNSRRRKVDEISIYFPSPPPIERLRDVFEFASWPTRSSFEY